MGKNKKEKGLEAEKQIVAGEVAQPEAEVKAEVKAETENPAPQAENPAPQEEAKPEEQTEQQPKQEATYGGFPLIPVLDAVEGIKFDFNDGLRVFFPNNGNKYHLMFKDADTNIILTNEDVKPDTVVSSVKKFYIRYHMVITRQGTGEVVFDYTMDLKDKKVIVQFPVSTIGDSIGWFSYVERFQQKFGCEVYLVISDFMRELVEKQYPQFHYIKKEETPTLGSYACYYIGLFFKGDTNYQPIDFRLVGLHRTAGYIMGLRSKEELEDIPPRFDLSAPRQIKEKYVCIATKASAQCKFWNHPFGWDNTIRFLRDNGYRVLCIDKERVWGTGNMFHQLPWGVEDYTGDIPLQERINLIKDADFFIGLGSGLSWVAWGCQVPVVLISGFSLPNTEFYTPYRVINYQACIGCWDDTKENFDHNNYFWCPRHQDDELARYECTRAITPEMVINTIKTIPTFKPKED